MLRELWRLSRRAISLSKADSHRCAEIEREFCAGANSCVGATGVSFERKRDPKNLSVAFYWLFHITLRSRLYFQAVNPVPGKLESGFGKIFFEFENVGLSVRGHAEAE